MKLLITISIFFLMLIVFLANPAPVSIESYDFILIILPCFLALISLFSTKEFRFYKVDCDLMFAAFIYASYLLLSILIGLLQNVPLLNVLRATGPYINFFPLIFVSLFPGKIVRSIAVILVIIGILQCIYQLHLYYIYYLYRSYIYYPYYLYLSSVSASPLIAPCLVN